MRHFITSSSQSAVKLIKMGFAHGKDFDCQEPNCQVCKPWRDKDRKEYLAMSPEDRDKLSWRKIGK